MIKVVQSNLEMMKLTFTCSQRPKGIYIGTEGVSAKAAQSPPPQEQVDLEDPEIDVKWYISEGWDIL